MGVECPKCHFDNPSDSKFCKECGTQIISSKDIPVTETLETPKEELTTGSTFAGRYQIIEELGKGGMGKVYKVLDKEIKTKIALKLIKPEIAADKKTIERFRNELKTARDISHTNICRMYDLNKEEGSYYITMEYVEGQDLKSLVRQTGQLAIPTTISIAKQVCEGLSEAHKLGTVHRDLKPSNIMVDKEGNARIMDFGIARSVSGKGITGAGVMVGTPEYMSPEQVESKETDQRSDVYSLGVILFEMVTGRVPFEGDTPLSVAVKHKTEAPQDPRQINTQIPKDLSHLILRCMEKNKEKRYQSAEEIRSELENIEKGIPPTERIVPKRKPITSKEITVTFGLKKLLIPALVVIALVIAAVIIWRPWSQREAVFSPKIENSVAVISFENQTGNESYDYLQKAIPNLLITKLENAGYFYVTTWERMYDVLKQMGKGDTEVIDSDMGFELCRREGIEYIVIGSYIKAEDMFATDVKVMDVETKKLLKSTSSRGKGLNSIIETQIDELSREIALGMGIAKQKIETDQQEIIDVTTNSMEAYSYFLMGREAHQKWFYNEAQQFYEKALELDPSFASALLYLAGTRIALGDAEGRNKAIEKAKAFSEKVTEKERLYIDASYATTIEGDREKRFRIFKQIAEKYPKEKSAHLALANYYTEKNMMNEAMEEFNEALNLDPNYGAALNDLAFLYANIGNFDHSLEYLNKYASLSSDNAIPLASIAQVYFMMGRFDEAIANLKEALKIRPNYYNLYWAISYIYAFKEDYTEAMKWIDQYITAVPYVVSKIIGIGTKGLYLYWLGRIENALNELNKSIELAVETENYYGKGFTDTMKAWIYYDIEEYEKGQEHYKNLIRYVQDYYPGYMPYYTADYNLYFGFTELKLGKIESAKSRLTKMNSVLPQVRPSLIELKRFHIQVFHAEVLLAEGKIEQVINTSKKELSVKAPPIRSDWRTIVFNIPFLKNVLARAYQQKGELDEAIAEYERLMNISTDSKNRLLIHPKYHYWLAKLYEQKGWEAKSVEHYEKFLDLWKDADPGIAEVEDAKKRLAGLKLK